MAEFLKMQRGLPFEQEHSDILLHKEKNIKFFPSLINITNLDLLVKR